MRRFCYWLLLCVAALCAAAGVVLTARSVHVVVDNDNSMEDTIVPGDRLLYVAAGRLRLGDIVLYRAGAAGLAVRRVIGLPGDRVVCCNAEHRITVDGRALRESYVYPGERPSLRSFSVTLRAGQAWLLGDHRSIALDSLETGPARLASIVGRITVIDHDGRLTAVRTPATFVADGLAPPDHRPVLPLAWPLTAAVSLAALVLLVAGGLAAQAWRAWARHRTARLAAA